MDALVTPFWVRLSEYDSSSHVQATLPVANNCKGPAGVYFDTSSGSVYVSADEGEGFALVARDLPTITSVETLVVE